jgi:hypothetical protein
MTWRPRVLSLFLSWTVALLLASGQETEKGKERKSGDAEQSITKITKNAVYETFNIFNFNWLQISLNWSIIIDSLKTIQNFNKIDNQYRQYIQSSIFNLRYQSLTFLKFNVFNIPCARSLNQLIFLYSCAQ